MSSSLKFTQQQVDAQNAKVSRANPKATLADLIVSYKQTGSVWATAGKFGMCGQSVHERLSKAGVINPPTFTSEHKKLIEDAYRKGFKAGDGILESLEKVTGCHRTNICRYARKLGLTNSSRKLNDALCVQNGATAKLRIETNGHPRGMLGKKHTDATKLEISRLSMGRPVSFETRRKIVKTHRERYGSMAPNVRRGTWKAEWVEIGGQRFFARSQWEANYAHYLEFQKLQGLIKSWEHEPHTFWFEGIRRGCCSYLPDFRVVYPSARVEFHEVKGWMDARSITKIKRMAKYFPHVALIVRDASWYRANRFNLSRIVKGWKQ